MSRRHLKSSVAWVLGENCINLLAAVFATLFAARIIGPQAFGLASIAFFIGSLAETLVATPFAEALIQRRRLNVSVIDTAHTAVAGCGCAAFLLLCGLAPLFSWIYHQTQLTALIIGQGSTCLFLGLRGVSEAVLARKLRFKALSIRNIVAKSLGAIVTVVAAIAGAGPWSLILGNILFSALSTVMVWRAMGRKPRFSFVAEEAVQLLKFGVFTLLDALLWVATPRLFGFLFGYYQGVRAVGLLNIAFRINDALCAILASLSVRMALPLLAPLAHDRDQLASAFAKGTRLIFLVSAPAFAGLALVSKDLLAIFLGPEWIPATTALVIVCLYSICNFARVLAQPAIKAAGKPALLLWLHFIGLAYVGLGSIYTARFGPAGQLYLWASFGVVYFIVSAYLLDAATGISWASQVAPLLPAAFCTGCMSLLILLLEPLLTFSPYIALSVKVLTGGSFYLVMILLLERRFLFPLFVRPPAAGGKMVMEP